MPQPFIFRTIDLDGQTIRTAVRPGKSHLTPLLIFNGIGANLELVFPFVQALDPDLEVIAFDVPGKPKVLWLMASPRRYIQPSHVVRIAPMIYGGSFRRDSKLAAEHASKVRSAGKLGYYWQLFAGLGWTSIHWLHKIRQPTLVLAGDDDPLIPLVNMRMLAWRIPNAQLHIIDDGHLFLITRAEAVAPIIMKFLEEERLRAVIHPRPAV